MFMSFRQIFHIGLMLVSASAIAKIPQRPPMVECKREPDDQYVKQDKQKVRDEVTAFYGEVTVANLMECIRESHNSCTTMRMTAEPYTEEYGNQYVKMEEMEARVWYGLAILSDQFPDNKEAAAFMIELFREIPLNVRGFYPNHIRFKIAYELGNMQDPSAAEMLMGILVSDPDAYSVRSIAAKQLTCHRSGLPPEKRELLFSALVASLAHSSYSFVGDAADALGDIGDSRALPALQRALSVPENRDWPFSRKSLEEAIARLSGII